MLHEREYLVAVKSTEGALALITLHYREEILPEPQIAPEEDKITAQEKSRFKKTIAKMLTDFNPDHYADVRRAKILDLLKKKVGRQAPVMAPEVEAAEGEGPADLVAALEESMRQVKKSREP